MIRVTPALLLLATAIPLCAPARGDTVRARVEGLRGDLKDHVEAYLQSQRLDGETVLEPAQLEARVAEVRSALEQQLEPFGYYTPEIRVDLEPGANGNDDRGREWNATFTVDPGPPVRVSSLDLELSGDGAQEPELLQTRSEFPLQPQSVFSHVLYESGKNRIAEIGTRLGYLEAWFVEHRVVVDPEHQTAAISLHYATGRRFLFGPLLIQPDGILQDRTLRSYAAFAEGDPFRYADLLRMQRDLLNSGYFDDVEVTAEPQLEGPLPPLAVPIRVHLVAARPRKYSLGGGYHTDIGPRASLGLELRRLDRWGDRLSSEVQLSEVESFGKAQLVLPHRERSRTDRFVLDLGYASSRPDTSQTETAVAALGWSHNSRRRLDSATLQWRRDDFDVGTLTDQSDFLLLIGAQTRIESDDPIYARRGQRMHWELSFGDSSLLSDTDLIRMVADGKWIRPLGDRFRLLSRADLGYLTTPDFDKLPPTLRFYTGGDQSLRGFGYQEIGAVAEDGGVIGGDARAVASVELERRLFKRWGVAAFVDGGNAFLADQPPPLGDWKLGVGVGARWLSPIGLIRIDVAAAVSEPGNPVRIHIGIGPDL